MAVVVVALACLGAAAAAPGAPVAGRAAVVQRPTQLESDVLAALNSIRRDRGLAALKPSPQLARAAAQHSREMADIGYFKHESADGSAFWKRLERFYPPNATRPWAVGETLLWASPAVDAAGAARMWMESPEHRATILAPRWREIGVAAVTADGAPGVYEGLDVLIVTADFGVRR